MENSAKEGFFLIGIPDHWRQICATRSLDEGRQLAAFLKCFGLGVPPHAKAEGFCFLKRGWGGGCNYLYQFYKKGMFPPSDLRQNIPTWTPHCNPQTVASLPIWQNKQEVAHYEKRS